MKWENWVKKHLRMYLFRNIDLERIKSDIDQLEMDIQPTVSQYNPALGKKTPYRNGSVVEFYAIKREKSRKYLLRRKEWLETQIRVVENAINQLSDIDKKVISNAFLSLDCKNDRELAELVDVPYLEIKGCKSEALGNLYELILAGYNGHSNLKAGEM